MSPRAVLPLLAVAALLAGCPIPQPLPEYSAGTVTPPRILADDQLAPKNGSFDGAVTLIPANCMTIAPTRDLTASIVDSNTVEGVEARWFVNYDYREAWLRHYESQIIPPAANNTDRRLIPTWEFVPYNYAPPYGTPALPGPAYRDPGVLRVVELVVSNGFDPSVVGTFPGSNRAPKPGFETQVYRWVFLTVPESASVPCPQ